MKKMAAGPLILILCLTVLGGTLTSVAKQPIEKRSDSAPCKQAYLDYHNTQDTLFSASEELKKCAASNDLHNDCSTAFESVGTSFQKMQWVLKHKLHPLCDEL